MSHETSLGRQIDTSERRAEIRCAECDLENIYWQRRDTLANFTKILKPLSIEDETNKEVKVSQKDVVILPSSLDEDSFFGFRSLSSTKKKKSNNSK